MNKPKRINLKSKKKLSSVLIQNDEILVVINAGYDEKPSTFETVNMTTAWQLGLWLKWNFLAINLPFVLFIQLLKIAYG